MVRLISGPSPTRALRPAIPTRALRPLPSPISQLGLRFEETLLRPHYSSRPKAHSPTGVVVPRGGPPRGWAAWCDRVGTIRIRRLLAAGRSTFQIPCRGFRVIFPTFFQNVPTFSWMASRKNIAHHISMQNYHTNPLRMVRTHGNQYKSYIIPRSWKKTCPHSAFLILIQAYIYNYILLHNKLLSFTVM